MANTPSPQTLLIKRIVEKLKDTAVFSGSSNEPEWNSTIITRVMGVMVEVVLDAVAHGEEVQLGRLGLFFPKVYEERVVSSNLQGGEKKTIPRRIRLGFDAHPSADHRAQEFNAFLKEFDGNGNGKNEK